jgi:PKD domain/Glucose / Sorbosone dehydrogenase
MEFGNDGHLYVTTGDDDDIINSQNMSTTHGSLLRLTMNGKTPVDNPFTNKTGHNTYHCGDSGGKIPSRVNASVAVCSEIFATGLRNPFRMSKNSSIKEKTVLVISDVGDLHWEELNYAGTDYPGANYGWGIYEGPCLSGSYIDCPLQDDDFVEPFHWYQHELLSQDPDHSEEGCVSASVFIPNEIGWPQEYKFLFADFTFHAVYLLTEDPASECRSCQPPVSGFQTQTFHETVQDEGDGFEGRIVDLFFGPYEDSHALYIVKYGYSDSVLRVRYTGILNNHPPFVDFAVEDRAFDIGEEVHFDGSLTVDPDGDELFYYWSFGDGATSTDVNPTHVYSERGEFEVLLVVVDALNQKQEKHDVVVIGTPPTAKIISPLEGQEFFVGQVFRLKGEGFHANGSKFDDSELEWNVIRHHGSHFHPFLDPIKGNDFDLYPAPPPEDFRARQISHLEVFLRVTDDDGLTSEASILLYPERVKVEIATDPSGLEVFVGYGVRQTPTSLRSWSNYDIPLWAEDQLPFVFQSWSDGVTSRQRNLHCGKHSVGIVAQFCVVEGGSCLQGGCCEGACADSGLCVHQQS